MFGKKKYLPYLLILLAVLVVIYFVLSNSSTSGSTSGSTSDSTSGSSFGSTFSKGGKGGKGGKEGFVQMTWSAQTIKNFLNFEKTANPNLIFDVDIIQQQATESEVKTLLKTGKWPWDTETKKLYINAIKKNTMLKVSPEASMEQARTIYNQTIIREMISWSAPEGQFLLHGGYSINTNKDYNNNGSGTFGIDSGLVTKNNNLIRCGVDKNNNKKAVLQEIQNQGNDGITGAHKSKTINLDYKKLPTLIQGFRFINSPCDPCVALNSPPNYTCPFSLTSKDPSPIWQSLWGLQASSSDSTESSSSCNKKTKFPLLLELQSELNTMFPETGISINNS